MKWLLHRLRHWVHWQPIEVVAETRAGTVWVGARCVICGEISDWGPARL